MTIRILILLLVQFFAIHLSCQTITGRIDSIQKDTLTRIWIKNEPYVLNHSYKKLNLWIKRRRKLKITYTEYQNVKYIKEIDNPFMLNLTYGIYIVGILTYSAILVINN